MSVLKQYADHLIKTVGPLVGSALVVEKLNNPTVRNFRQQTCRGDVEKGIKPCSFYNPDRDQCKVCKCFISEKSDSKVNYNPYKLRNEVTHCPMGWWDDQEVLELESQK